MAFFKKKPKDLSQLPEFPEFPKEEALQFPSYAPKDLSPKDFPSLKEIKNAVQSSRLDEPKEFPKLGSMPKLTETITYEPKKEDSARFAPLKLEQPSGIPLRRSPIAKSAAPRPMHQLASRPLPQIPPKPQPRSFPILDSSYQGYQPARQGKPLYVQIEEYNKIIETVNNIKYSIEEADRILSNLRQIKDRENEELTRWANHLNNLKEKLLAINKRLDEL